MNIAYVAHAERCVLLLDDEGVCRWVVRKAEDEGVAVSARRCIGAQFVASLDATARSPLLHEPKVGTSLLFARVDEGRVTLVRFGPLLRFETLETPSCVEALDAKVTRELEAAPKAVPVITPAAPGTERMIPPAPDSDITVQRPTLASAPDDMDDMDDRATSEIATVRSSGFAIRIAPGVMADEPEGETRPFTRHDHDELRGRVAMTGSRRRGALPIRH